MASNRELRPFGLETFSLWCAKRLLERHPEWLPLVSPLEGEQDGLRVRTLAINLPSENPQIPEPLTLSVDLERIVAVSWFSMQRTLRWHRDWVFYMPHHPRPAGWHDERGGLDQVAAFVEQILAEEVAAIWTEDTMDGGEAFWSVSAQDVRTGAFKRGRARTEVRSWRGTLDASL